MKPTNHQTQVILQVFLPLVLAILIVAAVPVLFFIKMPEGNLDYQKWSNISVLFIAFPVILSSFVFFFGICVAIYINSIFKRKMITLLGKLSEFSSKSSRTIINILPFISKPVIQIGSILSPILTTKIESTGKTHERK